MPSRYDSPRSLESQSVRFNFVSVRVDLFITTFPIQPVQLDLQKMACVEKLRTKHLTLAARFDDQTVNPRVQVRIAPTLP